MSDSDFQACLNAALEKAQGSNSAGVKIAYFELANFYHRKIEDAAKIDSRTHLLRELAPECCCETRCWCKTRDATDDVGSAA